MKKFTMQDLVDAGFPFIIQAHLDENKPADNQISKQDEHCERCSEHDNTTCAASTEETGCLVFLSQSQVSILIDFIETEFIPMLRNDPEIDNIDYVVNMMGILLELRSVMEEATNHDHVMINMEDVVLC